MKRALTTIFLILLTQQFLFSQVSKEDHATFMRHIKTARGFYNINADSSLYYSDKSLEIAKKSNVDSLFFYSYLAIGNAYSKLYKFAPAVENYLKGLKLVENDDAKKAMILGNLGVLYKDNRKYDESQRYFKLSYEASVKANAFEIQINQLNNMIDNYLMRRIPDSALVLLFRALDISKKHNLMRKTCFTYDNIANTFYSKADISGKKEDFKIVELYADTALAFHRELKDSLGINYTYGLLGATHAKLENYKKAEEFYQLYQSTNIKMHDVASLLIGYDEMSLLYQMQGKFEKAYWNRIKYDSIYKLYLNETSNQQMEELNTKYKTEKKEKENQLLLAENNLNDETIKRQKITVISVILGLIVLLAGSVFIFINLRNQKKANKVIFEQKTEVEFQKRLVDEKNKEITDSINYAKRLQKAILASEKTMHSVFEQSFIFYKPKDIVSGDFYWILHIEDKTIKKNIFAFAAADCTGHGVPGAFMSMLNSTLLNQTAYNPDVNTPADALNFLNRELPKNLRSADGTENINDGMDIAFCLVNINEMILKYSGANNPCWLVRDNELIELKPLKQAITASTEYEKKTFVDQMIALKKDDSIYIFTDGYADQFGGPKGKKFKYKTLGELLLSINKEPMNKQRQILEQRFTEWKGDLEQIDDVLVMGIRI